jgi:hypothetical protein
MQLVRLESTTLAWVRYDRVRRRLEIAFRSGERYLYFQVPPLCYEQLIRSESKGAYFNGYIRNCFPFQHISRPSAPVVLAAPGKSK